MIKDRILKSLFIPALGYCIPVFSGLTNYRDMGLWKAFASLVLFTLTSFLIWQGSVFILAKTRSLLFGSPLYLKLPLSLVIQAIYGSFLVILACIVWYRLGLHDLSSQEFWKSVLLTVVAIMIFTLVYEIMFLSKERELDAFALHQIENELKEAEIQILKNELDPHFVYNTLMPLCYLINNDIGRAKEFAHKILQVYQYLLENRHKDFVSLKEELEFCNNYFYLLQVRYTDSIKLSIKNHVPSELETIKTLPFSLQTLIENAIKHTIFSKEEPLKIEIILERESLTVKNNYYPKLTTRPTSKIGLKNLRARVRLLINANISVTATKDHFVVKIPLMNESMYDRINNNRRRFTNL